MSGFRDLMLSKLRFVSDCKYIYIEVTIPNTPGLTELIVFPAAAKDVKLDYISNTYDQAGVHNRCSDIRIVDYGTTDTPTKSEATV